VNPSIDLLGFLTLGFLGGLGHCVGMCSPFVLFVSRRYTPPDAGTPAVFAAQAWYHAGRLVTYAVLGATAGALGGVVQMAGALVGVQRAALIVAGVALVAWGVASLSNTFIVGPASGQSSAAQPLAGRLFSRLAGALKRQAPGHPFVTGLFLGLLPCGLLYSAVIAAVARGSAVQGASALALFAIGTAPALLAVSLADELLARHRLVANRLSQFFILAMGAWFLWRGLVQ
jgi:uncharacterized protein